VTNVNRATGKRFVVKTNAKGYAVFAKVPMGSYKVTASSGHTVRLTRTLDAKAVTVTIAMHVAVRND
jgi:hypothetical protein